MKSACCSFPHDYSEMIPGDHYKIVDSAVAFVRETPKAKSHFKGNPPENM